MPRSLLRGCAAAVSLAARARQLVAEAFEDLVAVLAPVILGKDLFRAAQIHSTAAGGAHKKEMGF